MENSRECTICAQSVSTNFCGNCGQKVNVTRSTVWSLIGDFFSSFSSLDGSVPSAFKKLLVSPYTIINNYSNGYRKYYPSPGQMMIYALTIAILHLKFINAKLLGGVLDVEFVINDYTASAQVLFLITLICVFVLVSYVTFIRRKIGFTKHLISILYLTMLFFIVVTLLFDFLLLFEIAVPQTQFVTYVSLVFVWNSIVLTQKRRVLRIFVNSIIQFSLFALFLYGISILVD